MKKDGLVAGTAPLEHTTILMVQLSAACVLQERTVQTHLLTHQTALQGTTVPRGPVDALSAWMDTTAPLQHLHHVQNVLQVRTVLTKQLYLACALEGHSVKRVTMPALTVCQAFTVQ